MNKCEHCGAYASRCHEDAPRRRATVCAVTGKVIVRWQKARSMDRYQAAVTGTDPRACERPNRALRSIWKLP